MEQKRVAAHTTSGGSARAVERTLDLLLVFLHGSHEVGISDLSRTLQLPKATVHRLVNALTGRGFLSRNPETARYRVGVNMFRLGSLFLAQTEVRRAALPVIQELAQRTGETVNLNVVSDRRRVCLEKAESTHDIRHFVELGRPLPLYSGASGKVLLAFLDPAQINAVIAEGLKPLTPRTITDAHRLRRNLLKIRRRGYAVSRDERVIGAAAVSAPIRDHAGGLVAGLTISGPTFRFIPSRVRQYVAFALEGAGRISAALGYVTPRTARAVPRRAHLFRAGVSR